MEERSIARAVLDSVSEMVLYQSVDGEIVWANRALQEFFSMSGGELSGKRCYEVLVGRRERCPECPARRILQTNRPARSTISHPGGVWDVQILPDHDREGNLVGLLEIAEDITAADGCRSEELYRLAAFQQCMAYNTRVWVSVLDADGSVAIWNRGAEEISGYTEEEVLGRAEIWTWLCDDRQDREEMRRLMCRIPGENGKPGDSEITIRTRDGRERIMAWWARSLTRDGQLEGSVVMGWDVTEQKRQEERIRYLRFHDPLTGLYNRMFFEEEIERLDTPRQLPLSVVLADVNGLKLVNDSLGYRRGDALLKQTAELLQRNLRAEDIIARWGGDEFAILLPQTSGAEVESICQRIREESSDWRGEDEIPVSLSLGAAVKERPGQRITRVVREAEERMYMYKLTVDRSARSAILRALIRSLGAKSHETEEHVRRLEDMALAVGRRIGLSSMELHRLSLLASLHDIGKISVPEELLVKAGELTGDEWKILKEHAEIGHRMASSTDEFVHVADDILHHHERWDGGGYPDGLSGEEIPLLSRIIAIVDAYDAMRSSRPYSSAHPADEAISELRRCAGSQFDPQLVEVFSTLVEEGRISWKPEEEAGGAEADNAGPERRRLS